MSFRLLYLFFLCGAIASGTIILIEMQLGKLPPAFGWTTLIVLVLGAALILNNLEEKT